MGLFDYFRSNDAERKTRAVQERTSDRLYLRPLMSAYENMFSQLRPLIDEMKMVQPYGVGRNGAKIGLNRTPELACLYDPNENMSWCEFFDAMFTQWLSEPALFVHVHKTKRGKVIGYSILPYSSRSMNADGTYQWQITTTNGTMYRFTEDEVMTLRFSRSPKNLEIGISPATVALVWTQIDDLMAQYERAYFENGAVPATITFITAGSREDFEKKRKSLENGLKGARNRNKTVYAYRQMLDDGRMGDELEVKRIQGDNSTLAIKDLVNIINDRINKTVGVSNFIMGDDSSAKYDNAELSDYQFTKRRVRPALTSFWSQFQHELDRITGGLGYAINYDLEIPELTDRLKTKAETRRIEAEARQIEIENQILIRQMNTPTLPLTTESKKEAEHGGCKCHCHDVMERKPDSYTPVFVEGEERIKEIYDLLVMVAEDMFKDDPSVNLDEIKEKIVENLRLDAQDGVLEGANRIKVYALNGELKAEVGEILKDPSSYDLSKDFTTTLSDRIDLLVNKYSEDTRATFEAIKRQAIEQGITKSEMKKILSESLPTGRAEVISRNETNAAIMGGRYDLDRYIAKTYDMDCKLTWRTNPGCCDICAALEGSTVELDEPFPDHGFLDGEEYAFEQNRWNDNGKFPHAHVNCRCYAEEHWSIR